MATQASRKTNGSSGHPSFGQRVEHLGSGAQQWFTEAREVASDLGDTLDLLGRTRRNPYVMLAAAAGVGYVLAGGLITGLTARVLRTGVRLAAIPFVKAELLSFAENALHSWASSEEEKESSTEEQQPARRAASPAKEKEKEKEEKSS
jgi:hypothetical protein